MTMARVANKDCLISKGEEVIRIQMWSRSRDVKSGRGSRAARAQPCVPVSPAIVHVKPHVTANHKFCKMPSVSRAAI
ncbi:unnamed protein product, partial [Iphiclides podalirius]